MPTRINEIKIVKHDIKTIGINLLAGIRNLNAGKKK